MKDCDCVGFLQWALPKLQMRWPGFRKVRRQVCRRIDRRLIELELPDVAAYQTWIEEHPDELHILDGFCRITISRFYRDRGVFDQLRDDVLPALAALARASGRSEVLCWSAGCASGEEPYTVNIIWRRVVSPSLPDVDLKIVATDSDAAMLERADRGFYPPSSLKDFPASWLEGCFAAEGDGYVIRPEYRVGIEWRQQDIRNEMPAGPLDLILCRHLAFTYFDEPLQRKTLDQLISRLRIGGMLMTGKQEPLPTMPAALVERRPNTGLYRKRR